jgi:hypothetical protein
MKNYSNIRIKKVTNMGKSEKKRKKYWKIFYIWYNKYKE